MTASDLSPAAQRLLERRLRGRLEAGPDVIPSRRQNPESAPLSPAQLRLFFLDQLEGGGMNYLMPAAWQFTEALDVPALAAAIADLTERHQQLRVVFSTDEGQPRQYVLPNGSALTVLDHDPAVASLDEAVAAIASRPFDLATEPGFRATLLRVGPREQVLVLGLHHIVADGWSLGILERDLTACYGARLAGRHPQLPALTIEYTDYAYWQQEQAYAPQLRRSLDYWRETLSGMSPLELPTDHPRPAERSYLGASHTLVLPPELSAAIAELNQQFRTSDFMTLLAAFQLALSLHSGQDDIAVGTVVANRERPETEQLVGFFVNTLVLRTDLSDQPTPAELLARTRATVIDALTHQELPFERIVDDLSPERELSRNPLFDVLFAYTNDDEHCLQLGELAGQGYPIDLVTAKFDLSLQASGSAAGIELGFVYRPDLFTEASIERLAAHTVAALRSFVTAPDIRVTEQELLTEVERGLLLGQWPEVGEIAADHLPTARFSTQTDRAPDAVAVRGGGRSLTYAELSARADEVAARLLATGAGRGALIGISLARSVDLAVAVLGCWRAGAAYLPLDPAYPRPRLELMLADAGVHWALVDLTGASALDGLPVTTVPVEPGPGGQSPAAVEPVASDLAYVIYTSGSTGQPKGVEVTHGNLGWLLAAADRHFDFGPDDVWTLMHSYAFDFSVWELWAPLTSGGQVVVLTEEEVRDPVSVQHVLREHRVTVLNQTPAAFKGMRSQLAQSGDDLADYALRVVIFGADALDVRDYADWFETPAANRPVLVNMYGITETTVHVTFRLITEADPTGPVVSPIGRPLAGQRGYVLDRHRRLVPPGSVGELYVAGGGVARGYRNRRELTDERFRPDPYGRSGERMYRTGDLVRVLPDGAWAYVGRIDNQLKIRGFRIEPGEIESALRTCPGVGEAAVVARPDPRGGARLVGHVVLTGEATLVPAELRQQLRSSLPDHLVPALFVQHDRLPLTANGKVDRAALTGSEAVAGAQRDYVPPRTEAELVLAEVWAEVAGVERVGTGDNFFDLGGDSILALRVVGLSRKAGIQITVADLFRAGTLAELAVLASAATDDQLPPPVSPFSLLDPVDAARLPADVTDAYPLTMLQAGMLHEMLADPDRGAYHNVTDLKIKLPEGFDLAAFQSAADAIVAANDILRTSIDLAGHREPLQLVHSQAAIPVGYVDLRGVSHVQQRQVLRDYVAAEFDRRFELDRAPLVRLHLHQLTDQELRLTITDCHVILDGWSLTSVVADLVELHHQAVLHRRPPSLPSAIRFAEYVALERGAMQDEKSLEFWRKTLDELRPIRFARRGARSDGDQNSGIYEARRSFAGLAEPIAELARAAGVPRRTLLLTAFYQAMTWFVETDSTGFGHGIGLVTNGRPEWLGADQMRGLFLNSVPFGIPPGPGSWLDRVRAVFAAEQKLLPHRRVPLARLGQLRPGEPNLVEVLFNFVNFHRLSRDSWDESLEIARTAFVLNVNASLNGISFDADTAFVAPATVEQLADAVTAALSQMIADPDAPASRPTLTGAARRRALTDWAQGPVLANPPQLFHEVVAEWAGSQPDAIAVGFGDSEVSYATLEESARQLAVRLRSLGVGPEVIVGICAERGPDMVRAILAVLQAGGAFLPLEPAHPAERLGFIADDSGMRVLLTQRRLAGTVPFDGPTLLLDEPEPAVAVDAQLLDTETIRLPTPAPRPDNTAYVLYTSGSTGRPKGAAVPHRGLVNLIHGQHDVCRPTPADRILQFASFSFDVFVSELTWALANGATLCTAPRAELLPGPDLARTMHQFGITAMAMPPSVLGVLDPAEFPALATVVAGGEACTPELVSAWSLGRRFINSYGLTETSVWSCAEVCEPDTGYPPIGAPFRNSQVYVLDTDLQPVPVGVAGEIYLGGDPIGRGYLNRPGLTAATFVPDPFGHPGGRLFRTGDLGRYRADGAVEFIGRADSQVKLRGFRIELGEVEHALRGLPGIGEAVVLLRRDLPGEPALVAYVVPSAAAAAPDPDQLTRALRTGLPGYMVPAWFVVLPRFPLNSSNKIDRRALPAPSVQRDDARMSYLAPRTPAELVLAEIWQDVLGHAEIGVHDDFFQIGGSSLSTVRVAARSVARGLPITVQNLIETPTIAQLAATAATARPVRSAGPVQSEVQLRGGDRPPLYCVHPTGGSAAWYVPLARALPEGQPVLGYQAQGLLGGVDPQTVGGIAANYVAELLNRQPAEPARLLGWSMGANVALEMATQLHENGHPAATVILVEPHLPHPRSRQALRQFVADMVEAMDLREQARRLPVGPKRDGVVGQLRGVLLAAGMSGDEADLVEDAPIEVWHSLLAALADYELRPYPAHIQLVVGQAAADLPPGQAIPGLDVDYAGYLRQWQELALGGITVHVTPGDHLSMLAEPHVEAFAGWLTTVLDDRLPGAGATVAQPVCSTDQQG